MVLLVLFAQTQIPRKECLRRRGRDVSGKKQHKNKLSCPLWDARQWCLADDVGGEKILKVVGFILHPSYGKSMSVV